MDERELTPEERLMKVLVDGGVVLKDATPTYSELLSTVAQLAKVDKADVCPECNGYGDIYDREEGNYDCPTCKGTGKSQDSKLREKIAEELYGFDVRRWHRQGSTGMWNWNELRRHAEHTKIYYEIADRIIALFETDAISYSKGVLDGRRQERERIENIPNPFEGYVDVVENIRMAKSQGFERFRQALEVKDGS